MAATGLQAVRGMNDILPVDAAAWQRFEAVVRDWLAEYGYREIRTPLIEKTDLFVRSIGEVTDIVEKEMYTFTDLNGESITLRPEGTASCVRAVLEHSLLYPGPQRLCYAGPMFRHEKPQKGRYRQFHQVGVEAMGYAGPDIDVEQIAMCARLWRYLGIPDVQLEINTLGSAPTRALHRERLVEYLRAHESGLDEDSRRRLVSNPLRILDSKNPAMQSIIEGAPRLVDMLDDTARTHFDGLRAGLDSLGIRYRVNPRLVRGLDYYNLTVFEWVTDRLGAQGTVCGGGRYDGLVEQIGGRPTPACGFAMGIERLLALMAESGQAAEVLGPEVYVVHQGTAAAALAWRVAEQLRDSALRTVLHCGGGGFKSQMKRADASGARVALIVGDDEAAAGEVTVKRLREDAGQQRLPVAGAVDHIRDYLRNHGSL